MIELVYILRAFAEETMCNSQKKCDKSALCIKFGELEKFIFEELWQKERIAIYGTAWELKRELERLADLGILKYESDRIEIEDPDEFLKKTEPFVLVANNMTAGNSYLKHIIKKIQDSAREYIKGIEGLVPQSA